MHSQDQYGIGKIDSFQLNSQLSQNLNDMYMFNLQVSLSRNPFGCYDFSRQQSTLSNMQSVGRFQLRKDTAINEKGDIIIQQKINQQKQQNFDKDLDAIMLNKSIPVSVQKSLNINSEELDQSFLNLHELKNLPINMTNSQDIGQSQQKQYMKNSLNNSIFLDQSDQLRQQFNNFNPFNITQYQNESLMKYSSQKKNINQELFMQVSLIDKKMETLSEPDQHAIYYDQESSTVQNNQEIKQQLDDQNNDNSSDNINNNNNHFISEQYDQENIKKSNVKLESSKQQENPYSYQVHSDEEQQNKNAPSKIKKKISKKSQKQNKEQKRVSKCRQSRHKNVFKNFGGTLIRFIIYNQYFQQRVSDLFKQDAQKKKLFQDWLQSNIKLERKKDFQIAWTTFKTDSETIKEYKEVLRELSRDFFENFSFVYLINSRKISDLEIHLRSIHTYLAGINNPDSLERFKPI
ncbi:hypothetical protein TTHERM_00585200 (macronuclear) [Tetrahymena thermophila SB210]|uniref:Uncharacterized protein n=1 Tax=Tetrahymena thermophila (strain SB210) TaxID=312017 RepID=I7M6C6_TETTS|nr:hypothetical protein TTHERM_00585200 [Tetrahymena thermophila SB210]EAR84962.4 hypothetical protein TTHERM_00585200 [Tetrahymena thermophila SB210]|eukprot:XP_001032625.4 hypothetical protein TTHERM_00585200 [Tetrahymena thermophila SB210]